MEINWKEKFDFKKLTPHLIAIAAFLVIIFIYFNPVFDGKTLQPHDVLQANGAGHEASVWYNNTGKCILWTNSQFSGMPTYQIWLTYPSNLIGYLMPYFQLALPQPLGLVFLYFLCFYILLCVLRVKPIFSFIGSLAFAFSSYNVILIQAGHLNKGLAIGFAPLVFAGVFLALNRKYLWGFILSSIALSLEIRANHFQITYYIFLMIILLFVVCFIYSIMEKQILSFIKSVAVIMVAFIIAGLVDIAPLWINYEYSKYTMRGGTELKQKAGSDKIAPSGLQRDYAYAWSYGKMETFTLLIPKFNGGSSSEPLGESSNTYKTMLEKGVPRAEAKKYAEKMPLYWGSMSSTSGPVYFGGIICYLFILGLFILKNKIKWWLLFASLFAILLSWGENFTWLSNLFFDHFPMFNKFRVPMTLLVIASFCFPIMASLVLNEVVSGEIDKEKFIRALKNSFYIVGGLLLFFVLFGGTLFDYSAPGDKDFGTNGNDWIVDALKLDRARYLRLDAFRSLAFIFIVAASIFGYLKYNLKKQYFFGIIALAVLIDMWGVDKRNFNNKDFVNKKRHNQELFTPSDADLKIMRDKDLSYRVLNLSTSPFNDAFTSYFHKSIGGYSGAKFARYQDLIDYHIYPTNTTPYPGEVRNLITELQAGKPADDDKTPVLNMLNMKYIIFDQSEKGVYQNPWNLGNAWFVKDIKVVNNPDEEINSLNKLNLKNTAIVNNKFNSVIADLKPNTDSNGFIRLVNYNPDDMMYESKASSDALAVFSEIYYDKGWNAYIDGKLTNHIRANYILRALRVPAGNHKIEFKFEPRAYYTGEKISLASSLLIIIITLGSFAYFLFFKKEKVSKVI